MNVLQSTAAAAERVFEFLSEEEEVKETRYSLRQSLMQTKTSIKGQVTFENVHFGYTPDKIVINDFSMYIKPGKKIAIVGPTGAGKTTIVKLLMRFYELNSGSIYIDLLRQRDISQKRLTLTVRYGAAGCVAVQRNCHGESALWPPECYR